MFHVGPCFIAFILILLEVFSALISATAEIAVTKLIGKENSKPSHLIPRLLDNAQYVQAAISAILSSADLKRCLPMIPDSEKKSNEVNLKEASERLPV